MTHINLTLLISCPRGAVLSNLLKSPSFHFQNARHFTSKASALWSSNQDLKLAQPSPINDPGPSVKNETTAAHAGSAPQVQGNLSSSMNNFEPALIANPAILSDIPSQPQNPSNLSLIEEMTAEPSPLRVSIDSEEKRQKAIDSLLCEVDPRTVNRVCYFDTLALSKKLESRGFTREQAEACVVCLLEVIGNTLEHQAKHMVTKTEQRIAQQQLQSDIMSVQKDMVLLQKSEFSALRTETEKISIDMARVQSHFQDEVVKLKGQFTLDVNLERSRALEAHAASEKNIQTVDNKIETEIAHLKTTYEVYRNDIFKYAAGTVLTCTTLIIGFIRLWK